MQFNPFLLDVWLDQYEHGIDFNLAAPGRPGPLTTSSPSPTMKRATAS
jgi:hypothetical protein